MVDTGPNTTLLTPGPGPAENDLRRLNVQLERRVAELTQQLAAAVKLLLLVLFACESAVIEPSPSLK